ncbi:MAG: glycosyltransferase family 2 protein [Bacteroidia bacterium]|nr:glycosyltransferase family 2 protein [Bacteroidia bacterium]
MSKITIITPCYGNELNIPDYAVKMLENEKIFPADVEFEYILIDDGSKDNTWAAMQVFKQQYPDKVRIIKLVRNFGSTNAVFSSLPYATGDCIVIISADLQDPPDLILKLYENWKKGFKLVLANRTNREEPLMQKILSNSTHMMMKKFGLKNLPEGGFDMNLFDKEIKDILIKMDDKNSYFPFLLMWLGYEFVSIPYVRRKREIGKSGYTMAKKIKVFVDAFVAFSFFPIRLISISGLILGLLAFAYGIFVVAGKLLGYVDTQGWSSLMVVILFVSAFQMIALGIIGEYVWRGLEASRNRPNFLIEKVQ